MGQLGRINSACCYIKLKDQVFSNDSLLFKVTENDNDRELLQRDLSALEVWEELWQMRFNPTKCVVLRISNKKKPTRKTDYQLHGHTLEVVDASKYLRVTLTEDLSWDKHIQNTVSKKNRTVGFLRRNLWYCTLPVKASIFKKVVRPVLECASPVWDPHQQANNKALEQVQRREARYVYMNPMMCHKDARRPRMGTTRSKKKT